jgi:hypothetical protein
MEILPSKIRMEFCEKMIHRANISDSEVWSNLFSQTERFAQSWQSLAWLNLTADNNEKWSFVKRSED